MDNHERGGLIAKLRKEAGYTQKSLADALYVSDKAVSKWERGLCMPDASLLTRLSALLDVDVEYLISGCRPYGDKKWCGIIRCDDLDHEVAGKPLVHYLLSYFLLVGITDVSIFTKDREFARNQDFRQYGLNVIWNRSFDDRRSVVVFDKFFLFGANITRYFQNFLTSSHNVIPVLDGRELPIAFTDEPKFSWAWHKKTCERKSMGRGITCLPLKTPEEIADASAFIGIYEKYHQKRIADLAEIAQNRGLV